MRWSVPVASNPWGCYENKFAGMELHFENLIFLHVEPRDEEFACECYGNPRLHNQILIPAGFESVYLPDANANHLRSQHQGAKVEAQCKAFHRQSGKRR